MHNKISIWLVLGHILELSLCTLNTSNFPDLARLFAEESIKNSIRYGLCIGIGNSWWGLHFDF